MAGTTTTTPKKTKYQKLVTAKKNLCMGKAQKTDVKKAAKEYVASAVAKATKSAKAGDKATVAKKAKALAEKIANAVLHRGCSTSSYIAGKKKAAKKKATKKSTAKRTKK